MEDRPAGTLVSVNGITGALIGAAGAGVYLFAGIVTEIVIGRPGPDQTAGTILFGLPLLGGLGALVGASLGWVGHRIVRRTPLAGPSERSVLAVTLSAVVLMAGLSGVHVIRQSEARNQPRVMRSTGAVTRLVGFGDLTPDTSATLLFSPFWSVYVATLSWRGGALAVRLDGQMLVVSQNSAVVDQVDVAGLDDVREVHGVTVTDGQGREWLALLVRLRATGRREMLLIYDSAGSLVHQELLARIPSRGRSRGLWSSSRVGGEEGFLLDLGEPLRYVIEK